MRHIKEYELFEASAAATTPVLTTEQIEWLNKCTKV